ncbi:hydrogenase maturation nickel metallochaperone HypA/HybF [Corynebacterium hindlerae]|uniref:hydrogenase maturation nickel metallochaperone HypA/HybF n=1 Tax=Corynebacterium hindlerae TaxID=699041 RepID=UPI001AD73206|nr:hydrogenase maturation nickel metallochaperone HypA [Corynebacterium hindlerae]QTH60390.1 hydrogenase maturation nickel metallochaperone HypA [Corynebacterium hindlerae]
MHELGILTGVVSTVTEAAAGREIRSVGLRVGMRSGVIEEALHSSWPIAIAGTACADATLQIEMIPATVYCPACETEQPIDEFFALACPVCGTPTADLRHGREFEVAFVDVET